MQDFEQLGVQVIGVSKDSLASHARFRAQHGLTFPLLSDPDRAMMTAYAAWGEKVRYGKVVEGAIRSTVVLGPDGVVQCAFPKVKAKGHAAQVLAQLSDPE